MYSISELESPKLKKKCKKGFVVRFQRGISHTQKDYLWYHFFVDDSRFYSSITITTVVYHCMLPSSSTVDDGSWGRYWLELGQKKFKKKNSFERRCVSLVFLAKSYLRGWPGPILSQPTDLGLWEPGTLKKPPDKWATKMGPSSIGG